MDIEQVDLKVRESLPSKFSKTIGDELVGKIDALIIQDSELKDSVFDNLVDFKEILLEGSVRIDSFINATLYTSYYLMGKPRIQSFTKVFPARVAKFEKEGKTTGTINNIVGAYHRSKLVQRMLGQCQMPSYVMFRNVFFKAVKTQVEIMEDPNVSPTVRQKAACSLMGHLKEPEVQKVEIDVSHKEEGIDIIKELMTATKDLAISQSMAISEGTKTASEIAHSNIINAEYVEKVDE